MVVWIPDYHLNIRYRNTGQEKVPYSDVSVIQTPNSGFIWKSDLYLPVLGFRSPSKTQSNNKGFGCYSKPSHLIDLDHLNTGLLWYSDTAVKVIQWTTYLGDKKGHIKGWVCLSHLKSVKNCWYWTCSGKVI